MYIFMLVVVVWVGVLFLISWKNDLFRFVKSPENVSDSGEKVTKRLYFVDSWDSEKGRLYLVSKVDDKEEKISIFVDIANQRVISYSSPEVSELLLSVDYEKWKTLFCKGNSVMLYYKYFDNNTAKIVEIRNHRERNCDE